MNARNPADPLCADAHSTQPAAFASTDSAPSPGTTLGALAACLRYAVLPTGTWANAIPGGALLSYQRVAPADVTSQLPTAPRRLGDRPRYLAARPGPPALAPYHARRARSASSA
jgi:hypothetical protein